MISLKVEVNGAHKILRRRNLLQWKPKKPDWSDLPIDVLGLIANRLGLIDLLRFRVVCKNWNFASSDASAEIEALPNNDPWFLIYDYDSKCMLKTDESKKIYRTVKIPEMNGATCIASNHGWLLLFKTLGSGSMCFFCPFSRARIEIPEFPMKVFNPKQYVGKFSTPPTSNDCVICIVKIRRQNMLDLFVLQRGYVAWTKHEIPLGFPNKIRHAAFWRGVFYFLDNTFLREAQLMFLFTIGENSKSVFISRASSLAQNVFNRDLSTQTGSKLEGKVALITGAASGIGKAAAAKFISNGAKVIIADIQNQLGQDTARELGPNACFIPCDVTKESDISNAVDFTISKYKQLDIMYNNAGVPCYTPPSIVDLDLSVFDRVMGINVRGVLAGVKHASRVMIPCKSGSILCTASVTGMMGGLAQHTYSVSKSAVIGIVKSMAAELCQYGIRINCISPFAVPTPFTLQEMSQIFPHLDAEQHAKMIHSFGVLGQAKLEPGDVADAALYLASDDAKYVSGHNLVVDGGFTSFKRLGFPAPDQVQ
ncbi:hypothetical protein COLO4_08033 [Corchorus olitorius]|uniref:F-box domain-containing protein n=1 Tax=Corchorus olitorius TaxID=93759 RepID=A0A1R3KHN1_9ROSI|nr:hypothetical protein COLO4_08033 [Corchorus olitorius]